MQHFFQLLVPILQSGAALSALCCCQRVTALYGDSSCETGCHRNPRRELQGNAQQSQLTLKLWIALWLQAGLIILI